MPGLEKITRKLSSWYPGQDSKPHPPEYDTGMLPSVYDFRYSSDLLSEATLPPYMDIRPSCKARFNSQCLLILRNF
jgi:hypothetical protein